MTDECLSSAGDEELARRAARGCDASFEELMRRYQAPVLHFLQRRGGGADAEDLVQETFLRVYANLHRYRPRWRLATWIFTIARRVGINHHRRQRPRGDGEALEAVVCPRPGPLETVVVSEDRRSLWSAVAEVLAEEQVTALWLYYVEDLPTREIARVLGRSWVSVKTMLFRARKKLLPLARAWDSGRPSVAGQARACSPAASIAPDNSPAITKEVESRSPASAEVHHV